MTAPSSSKEPVRRSAFGRVIALIAAIILVIASFGASVASAAPAAEPSSADMSAVAMQQLLAETASGAGSCGAPVMSSPFGVFDGRGAGALNYLAAPPPPAGDLWVQCSLAFSNGKPGGDCEGKHIINWNVIGAEPGTTVTAELFALRTDGSPLARFVVNKNQNVQMNSRVSPSDWKSTKNKDTYDIFAPTALLKVTALEPDGDTATAYCTAIPYLDVVQPSGGVVSQTEGEAAIDFLAAVPRTDLSKLKLYLDGVDVLPAIAANEGGLQKCTYQSPCDGALPGGGTYKDVIVDVASSVGTLASNTISGSFENLDCGGHVVRITGGAAGDFRKTTPQCNTDDLTEAANISIFDVNVTEIGDLAVAANLITTQVPTHVEGNICAGAKIIAANVNGLPLDLTGQTTTNLGVHSSGRSHRP